MTGIMHEIESATTHPVRCPAALDVTSGEATSHGGAHMCRHPAATEAENAVPGFMVHRCVYVGCRVIWTRPSPAMARMSGEELRLLMEGPDLTRMYAELAEAEAAAREAGAGS